MNRRIGRVGTALVLTSVSFLAGCVSFGTDDKRLSSGERGEVVDVDGNLYRTVRIGTQVWMAEDFRATRNADGTPIPDGTGDEDGSEEPRRYRVVRHGESAPIKSGEVYLYNWAAAVQAAPKGWHLPSLDEWHELEHNLEALGFDPIAPALLGTGTLSGFDAELSGAWFRGRFLDNYKGSTQFWSSTRVEDRSPPHAFCPHLGIESGLLVTNGADVLAGWSVRYVKDGD